MEEEKIQQMTDSLTAIYDNRLKSLIGYEDTRFTRGLIRYMFELYEHIGIKTENNGYLHVHLGYLWDVLNYQPGSKDLSSKGVSSSGKELVNTLENFIRAINDLLYPNWNKYYPADAWRKVLGDHFKKLVNDNKSLYPAPLSQPAFFSQLNQTTVYRNQLDHKEKYRGSGQYTRYYILKAYDAILCYLLYTFYYMCLKPADGTEEDYKRIQTLKNYLYVKSDVTE